MTEKKNRIGYLLKNTMIFAIGNLSARLISFVLVPLYTNALSTAEYGVVDIIVTVCTVLAPVISFNISEGIMRFSLEPDAERNRIMSVGLVCVLISGALGLLILPAVKKIPGVFPYSSLLYFYMVLLSGSQVFLSYLRGKEKLVQYSLANILNTICVAVFNIYYLVIAGQGISGYFKAYIYASLITIVYAAFAGDVQTVVRNFRFDRSIARRMVGYSIVLVPNTFMWWIINSSDRIMVSAMISAAANGIYAVSYKLPSIIQIVTNIFNQAWGYSAIRENNSNDRDAYYTQIFHFVLMISSVSCVGIMAIAKPLMRVYVSASFYEAWRYIPYLAVGCVFSTLATFLGTSYTVNMDSKGNLFSATCGAVVNLVLNYLLIPGMGVAGAAAATCISYAAVFVYRLFDTRKYVRVAVFSVRNISVLILLVISAVTMFFDTILGTVFLFCQLLCVVILFQDLWMKIALEIIKKTRRNKGK